MRALLCAILLAGVSAFSGTSRAQFVCPFNVSGAATPRATVDGLLMTRYALGKRENKLTAGIAGSNDLSLVEGRIDAELNRLDVDGDNVFSHRDVLIILRYLSGHRGARLIDGITFTPVYTQRTSAIAIEQYIANGCLSTSVAVTAKDSARLLQQATWGPTLDEIHRIQGIGARAWIEDQFSLPATSYADYAQSVIDTNFRDRPSCAATKGCAFEIQAAPFYKQVFEGRDQLRQRVVNALLQILVVSLNNSRLADSGLAVPSYMDTLNQNAFGNFRALLKDMTLSPAMGIYLDMLGSSRENPNENYARELLQLFSIGTVLLNDDGSPKLDGSGKPIPSYTEAIVQDFSKVFTGWHFAAQNEVSEPWRFYWPEERWRQPMTPWRGRRCPQDGRWPAGSAAACIVSDPTRSFPPPHNDSAKTLLTYPGAPFTNIPAGQTPEQDLENAIDNVFNHPNVGPFIGRQLIMRMVTSNPSSAYIARVTAAFNNNGNNVRGDMKAVIRAILLDPEARDQSSAATNSYGKLREPVLKFLQLHRAFGARAPSGHYDVYGQIADPDQLSQAAWSAPSVFNFFSPEFEPAGVMATARLRGPEFEIATTSTIAGFASFTKWGIFGGFRSNAADGRGFVVDYRRYLEGSPNEAVADNPQKLVNELDLLLTAGNLKDPFKSQLVSFIGTITRTLPPAYTQTDYPTQRSDRLRAALWQVIHSPDYAIQR